jgi:chemotaxis regulatin CheY-phosphate phosphatase CheZ
MTSTNIPDAILKLSSVVDETNQAAQRVFALVERQKTLLKKNENHAATLEALMRSSPVDSHAAIKELTQSKAALSELHSLAHQIVEAQEFQDLCGQKVDKVIKLLSGLDDRLRLLFSQLRYPLPAPSTPAEELENSDIDQGAADDILKRFGL